MVRSPLVLLLFSCSVALAASPSPPASPTQKLSLSMILHSFDYEEQWDPPGKSTENGWLFGVAFGYEFDGGKSLPLWGRAQLDFSPSGTQYGSNETDFYGQSKDFTENTSDWFSRFEVDAGFTFYRIGGSSLDLTPYSGYGYRFWRRDISNHNDLQGYREEYSWSYIPVGLKSRLAFDRHWSLALDAACRIMVSGSIAIALPQFDSPTLTLGNKVGWQVALPVEYTSRDFWGLAVTFWYEYSAIGQSNNSPEVILGQQYAYIYEPASRTQQYGVTLTGSFVF